MDNDNAMRLLGGTYGSLHFRGGDSSSRDNILTVEDDVTFAGNAVERGDEDSDTNASTTPFGLIVDHSGNQRSDKYVRLEGNTVTTNNGVLIRDSDGESGDYSNGATIDLDDGGTLTVGGDLVYDGGAEAAANPGATDGHGGVSRDLGVISGSAGGTVNLAGNFTVNTASTDRGEALSTSTLNMNGGGTTQQFEVGDNAEQTDVENDSFAISTFNVGTDTTSSTTQLVNAVINDEAIDDDAPGDPNSKGDTTDRSGEQLTVGDLNINQGSTLDANTSQAVAYVEDALSIDATGTLDLNTQESLSLNDLIEEFVGEDDQTSVWNTQESTGTVLDSSNPGAEFTAVFNQLGNEQTLWQVSAIPEPASLVFMGLGGGLILLGRRRDGKRV